MIIKKSVLFAFVVLFFAVQSIKAQSNSKGFISGRQTISLNKGWLFKKDSIEIKKDSNVNNWQKVNLPHTWNAKDIQLGKGFYTGEASYEKKFFVDKNLETKRVFIRFDGVGQVAKVYVNNRFLGEHKGGYSAFCFEISKSLKYDTTNTILVKVNNKPRKDVIPINDDLFALYGGIYRPVNLIVTNKLNITTTDYASPGVYIKQENVSSKSADIFVTEKVENAWHTTKNVVMQCAVYDMDGKLVKTVKQPIVVLPQGRQSFTQHITLDQPHLWWGRKDPYLYKVVTTIWEDEKEIDNVTQSLGIRSCKIVAGKGFFLNGAPYRLYGVCRHQDWWGYGNALSYTQQDTDLALIKEIGATSIRFGHYQQSQHVYNDCDSIGFLVWTEIPFVNAVSGEEADNAKQQMTELIRQNYNHPSIYIWGTSNEVYCKTSDDYTARLIRTLNDLAKTEDPDRYTGSANGFGNLDRPENFYTDVQGVNRYYGWYEGKMGDLEKWVSSLEKKYPDVKVVLAEYGAGANISQHTEDVPEKVNYMKQFYPEEYQTKIHETQWSIIKKHPYLVSSYVWNMFDFCVPGAKVGGTPARNMKGLITFDRKIKKDAFYWYKANWSPEPVLYITNRRLTQRKNAVTNIEVYSNISAPTLYVNGKIIKAFKKGDTSVSYTFENVPLAKGLNTIRVKANRGDKQFEDTVRWTLL